MIFVFLSKDGYNGGSLSYKCMESGKWEPARGPGLVLNCESNSKNFFFALLTLFFLTLARFN